ncbi:hypothetical protein BU15DRAFT_65905 [Melanogaster broomeanus]|nr:hypothetical protein BU15DRAFT_65905 [Melanogaster broomeanus]
MPKTFCTLAGKGEVPNGIDYYPMLLVKAPMYPPSAPANPQNAPQIALSSFMIKPLGKPALPQMPEPLGEQEGQSTRLSPKVLFEKDPILWQRLCITQPRGAEVMIFRMDALFIKMSIGDLRANSKYL